MTAKTVALIGTFDTKGEEFSFLRARIENAGLRTLMIDVGVLGSATFEADISQAEVAAAATGARRPPRGCTASARGPG